MPMQMMGPGRRKTHGVGLRVDAAQAHTNGHDFGVVTCWDMCSEAQALFVFHAGNLQALAIVKLPA